MVDVLTCPACGFDPYDMIFYAIKQEFPDNNPRDVIEEMYKSGEYKDEADFYIFENHIDYCPNQDKLMKISAGFDTEEEAFSYAYHQGHAASRQNAPYKPNPTGKNTADFKKIYKQRAESTESKCSWWSGCDEEDEEITDCPECGSDFCSEHMCSDCDNCEEDCTCKCFECGENDRYDLTLNTGQRTCMDCSERCDECEDRFPNDEVRSNNINNKSYCDECRSEKGECYICDEILLNYYNDNGSCEVCDESVCSECSKETEDPKNPGYVQHDVACDNCVKEKKLVVTAESFAAPYAGAGSLMGIGQDTGLGSFTSKELTESSAIHGDFDSASLNYSGKQNLEVRAEASDSYDNLAHQDEMAQEAYQEYVQELDPATDYPPMSFEDWYEQTMAIYDTPEYDKYLEQQYLQMQEDEEELARQLMTLEADWRDLPRDSSGRWIKQDTQVSGYDSLVKIALKNAGYGEIYENQVTHLEYTQFQGQPVSKFYFVCITTNNNKMYAVGAYGSMSNRPGAKPNLSRIKLYNLYDNEPNGKTTTNFGIAKLRTASKINEKLRKGYVVISDSIAGAQYRDGNLDAYIDIQPGQSGTFPLPVEKQETFSESQITLRELSETMNALTGNLLGFDMAYRTVIDMLGSKDTPERREALLSTMEETIMTLEFYEETGYDGDIQMMVDIMRQNGMTPPPQFEEEVMARYQFEDKYAAEDKKILKPEVPADYNLQQTFGNNMVLMAEDSGMTDLQIVNLIESPFWEAWTTSTTPVNPGWWNLTISVRDLKMWSRGIKANRNWKVSDVKSYFNIRGNKDSLVTQIEAIQRLINNLQEGDAGSVARVNGIIEEYFHHVPKEAEEDEGPTIEDFFRDISKVLNKYGEFSWDSQLDTYYPDDLMIFFKGTLKPHNDANYFFQYDEDFSE